MSEILTDILRKHAPKKIKAASFDAKPVRTCPKAQTEGKKPPRRV